MHDFCVIVYLCFKAVYIVASHVLLSHVQGMTPKNHQNSESVHGSVSSSVALIPVLPKEIQYGSQHQFQRPNLRVGCSSSSQSA